MKLFLRLDKDNSTSEVWLEDNGSKINLLIQGVKIEAHVDMLIPKVELLIIPDEIEVITNDCETYITSKSI